MQKISVLRRLVPLFLSSCLLAACQMSANDLALTDNSIKQANKIEAPPTLSMAASTPGRAIEGGNADKGNAPKTRDRGSLSMEAAVLRAVGWHPSVEDATGRILQSEERIRAAKAGYYPQLNAGVNSGYQSRNREGWRPNLNVSASQMLYDFGKVSSSVEIERAGKNISQAQLLLAVDNLARDTANAVVEVQRYRQLLAFAQDQVEGVKRIAALVNERSDRGASTMSDKVQADARVESALATQLQYQSELSRWKVALAALIGGGSPDPRSDAPTWLGQACSVQTPDWDEVPAIRQAEAEKEEAQAQLAASRADGLPTVSLEASTGYDFNASRDDTRSNDRQPEYSVGINVSSSLYNGGQTAAQKRAAAHGLRSAEAAIRTARYDVERNLMESRSQVGTLGRLADALQSRASMMIKTRDLYREQYVQLGTRTLLDLLNAEQELHEARFQIANTTHDIRRLNINCLYNSGKIRQQFGVNAFALAGGVITQ
ncbi:TolC family outer membrane protein [Falsochrobactrum ovis]|uniref:Adhesin transport system outer membrane protein n=2 Tax=Falsochrobactrum ovis TaxID=1293442 RepID=A0A364JTK0_9HYPH|nr:TolC family outer membrane protein [Falsochrobactrum ovis]RAK27283.1 adhesin transport system outer membrane protein [Falsochrobactrum ovis]